MSGSFSRDTFSSDTFSTDDVVAAARPGRMCASALQTSFATSIKAPRFATTARQSGATFSVTTEILAC